MDKDLTSGDISTQIKQISIPASIGFFFYTMFNITDTYFASTISDNAIASLVLASTVFFMIISISSGMSRSVSSLVGNALGTKDHDKVQNIVVHSYIFAFFIVTFLYALSYLSVEYIFDLTSAKGEYLEGSIVFIGVILYGLSFYVFSAFSNAILTSHGDTKSFRNILIVNFFLNIILNYLFIYELNLGIAGIAYATITTESITMSYLLYKVYKLKIVSDLSIIKYNFTLIKELFIQGLPATLNMALMSLGSFILIYFISTLGEDIVSAYGIGIRLEQMALIPSIGLSVAVVAMISQNNGAKNYERIELIMKKIYQYAFILYAFGFVFMFLMAYTLTPLFTYSKIIENEVYTYIKVNAVLLLAYILIFANVSFLQAIKKPNMIFYIGLFRQIIMPSILFYLAYYFNMSALYYWLATFVSVAIATVYINSLQIKYLRELNAKI